MKTNKLFVEHTALGVVKAISKRKQLRKRRRAGIFLLFLVALLLVFVYEAKAQPYTPPDEYDEVNNAKLKDCQAIVFDEYFLGKKKQEILVCQWRVRINGVDYVVVKQVDKTNLNFFKE